MMRLILAGQDMLLKIVVMGLQGEIITVGYERNGYKVLACNHFD
jgi:hypothetical protein